VTTGMSSISRLSGYVLEPLRQSADFTLYRGRQHDNSSPVLAIALSAEQPSPQSLRRLEMRYHAPMTIASWNGAAKAITVNPDS